MDASIIDIHFNKVSSMRRAIDELAYGYRQEVIKQAGAKDTLAKAKDAVIDTWVKAKGLGSNALASPGSAAALLAGAGALGGGAIGAIADKKKRLRGAIIGALTGAGVGGATGAGIGHLNQQSALINARQEALEAEAVRRLENAAKERARI